MKVTKTIELTKAEVHEAINLFIMDKLGHSVNTFEIEISETGDHDRGTYHQDIEKVICTFEENLS